jgi:hypothetical protein
MRRLRRLIPAPPIDRAAFHRVFGDQDLPVLFCVPAIRTDWTETKRTRQ